MKLIASWGAAGSGKTTVALALAAVLAGKGQDVLLIGYDSRTPALPVFLPAATTLTAVNSIGTLLDRKSMTEASLKGHLHRHPKQKHLYFAGLVSGELASISYQPPKRAAVAGLLQLLQQSPFAYVIADCDTNPIYDALTLAALEHASTVLRTTTPDIKGFEGMKSQLAWLSNSEGFHVEQHIKISNLVLPTTPRKEAAALFGGFDAELPYARSVAEYSTAGELLCGFHEPAAIQFERKIAALAAEIERRNQT